MPKIESQRDQRQHIVAEDQFTRVWSYSIERETQDPCGQVSPANWTDPLNTPAEKYMAVPPGKFGQKQLGTLSLDWRRWAKDQDAALEVWRTGLYRIWKEVKTGLPYTLAEAENDPDILIHAGAGPWPSGAAIRYAFSKFGSKKDDETAQSLRGQRLERLEYPERKDAPGKFSMVNVLTDEAKAMLGLPGAWLDEAPIQVAKLDYHGFIKAKCAEGLPLKDAQEAWREVKAAAAANI